MIILKITMHAPGYAPLVTYMDTSRTPPLSAPSVCTGQQCSAGLQLLCGALLFLVENKDLCIFAYSPPTECLIF